MTECTSVPSLEDTYGLYTINRIYTIVVPDELYNSWITATNWSVVKLHIVRQSDYTA